MNDHDLLIRHDEQLRELSKLPGAIDLLTASLAALNVRLSVAQGQSRTVVAAVGIACSFFSCIGTWIVMIIFK